MQFPTVWLLFWKYLWSVFGVGYQKTGSITWVGRSHKGKCETFSTAKVKLGQKYFQTSYFAFECLYRSIDPVCLMKPDGKFDWINQSLSCIGLELGFGVDYPEIAAAKFSDQRHQRGGCWAEHVADKNIIISKTKKYFGSLPIYKKIVYFPNPKFCF